MSKPIDSSFFTNSDSNSAQRSTSKKQHILIPFVSESHLRQMRLFAENPDQQIDEFSLEFERGFIEMLSYRHGTKRVQANRVYQEYIGDKHHIHMNSTIWTSLTEICIYLGKEGKATVDETEKGWFIQYIDRDPRLMAKQAAMDQRKVVEYDEEERTRRSIDLQIAAAALRRNKEIFDAGGNASGEEDSSVPQDFIRAEGADRIEISLGTRKGVAMKRPLKLISFSEPVDNGNENFDRGEVDREPSAKRTIKLSVSSDLPCVPSSSYPSRQTSAQSMIPQSTATSSRSGPKSAMEQIMFEEEKKKQVAKDKSEKKERTDNWLQPGIVVKIMNKKVGDGKYYKKKGVIISVIDKYVGELSVLDCNAILKLDQEHLETVIPKVRAGLSFVDKDVDRRVRYDAE